MNHLRMFLHFMIVTCLIQLCFQLRYGGGGQSGHLLMVVVGQQHIRELEGVQ